MGNNFSYENTLEVDELINYIDTHNLIKDLSYEELDSIEDYLQNAINANNYIYNLVMMESAYIDEKGPNAVNIPFLLDDYYHIRHNEQTGEEYIIYWKSKFPKYFKEFRIENKTTAFVFTYRDAIELMARKLKLQIDLSVEVKVLEDTLAIDGVPELVNDYIEKKSLLNLCHKTIRSANRSKHTDIKKRAEDDKKEYEKNIRSIKNELGRLLTLN